MAFIKALNRWNGDDLENIKHAAVGVNALSLGQYISLVTGKFGKSISQASFKEEYPYEAEFAEHYEARIKPKIKRFEKIRIRHLSEAHRRASLCLKILLPVLFILFMGLYFVDAVSSLFHVIFFVIFFFIPVFLLLIWHEVGQYKAAVKRDIVPAILSFFEDLRYTANSQERMKQYKNVGIFPAYNHELSEDEIRGDYKDVEIRLFETELDKKVAGKIKGKSKGDFKTRTVFKGLVISLEGNREFTGKTIVAKDFGRIKNALKAKFKKLKNVPLETTHLEKIFQVYSENPAEAQTLLTPIFMEKLLQLSKLLSGTIQCCFYKKTLLLSIPIKKDLFEPTHSIFESADFIDHSKFLLKQINIVFSIIDELNLGQAQLAQW